MGKLTNSLSELKGKTLSREQFYTFLTNYNHGILSDIAAWDGSMHSDVNYFYCSGSNEYPSDYWDWCRANLKHPPFCYYSSSVDIWGFQNKEDVTWWVLKWAS